MDDIPASEALERLLVCTCSALSALPSGINDDFVGDKVVKKLPHGIILGDVQAVSAVVHSRPCRGRTWGGDAEREEVQSADLFWGARRWRVAD